MDPIRTTEDLMDSQYLRDGAQRFPRIPFDLVHKVQHSWFRSVAGTLSGLEEEEERLPW